MIKVKVTKENISILGHANYDDYGKDIVCSSASSIMITTINAIMMFDKNYITYEQKKNDFEIVINKNDKIVDNLIENMINMFIQLQEDYPKNIKIEEE